MNGGGKYPEDHAKGGGGPLFAGLLVLVFLIWLLYKLNVPPLLFGGLLVSLFLGWLLYKVYHSRVK